MPQDEKSLLEVPLNRKSLDQAAELIGARTGATGELSDSSKGQRRSKMSEPAQKEKQQETQAEAMLLGFLLRQLVLAEATDLARAGRYREAERCLEEGIPEPETMPEVLDLRARICAQQGRLGDAERFWTQALQLDPQNEAYAADLRRIVQYRLPRPFQRSRDSRKPSASQKKQE